MDQPTRPQQPECANAMLTARTLINDKVCELIERNEEERGELAQLALELDYYKGLLADAALDRATGEGRR